MVRAMAMIRRSSLLAAGVLLLMAAPAYAAGRHGGPPVVFADFLGIGHLAGSVFGGIGHALLGAFSWTFKLAAKFILITLGAIVKLLIPRSWAKEGVQIMQWIVEVPDYAGTITGPTGQHVYGFAGINELRDLFTWIGAGLLPLTLVYATSRAMVGHGDHVAIPLVRVLGLGGPADLLPVLVVASGGADQPDDAHGAVARPVVSGLHKLMLYAVDGVALGGWQLIDLGLMAAIAIELLGADLPEGRDHPARRAAVRDRADHDRAGPDRQRRDDHPRVVQRGRDAAGAAGRVGGGVRGRRAADQRRGHGRPADRRQQRCRHSARRGAARGRRPREPVAVPARRPRSERPVARPARRDARAGPRPPRHNKHDYCRRGCWRRAVASQLSRGGSSRLAVRRPGRSRRAASRARGSRARGAGRRRRAPRCARHSRPPAHAPGQRRRLLVRRC